MTYTKQLFNLKKRKNWQKRKSLALLIVILISLGLWVYGSHRDGQNNSSSTQSNSPSTSNSSTNGFNKNQYSQNDPSSIWVVVNKGRVLPSSYIPTDLVAPNIPLRLSSASDEMHVRKEAALALEGLIVAANTQNIHLMLASGYRSYSTQVSVYAAEVKGVGQVQADRESARPGHSEHQTGLAADLEPVSRTCQLDQCFANTPEGKWLAANSYKYGFIIRYPKDGESITGYEYEPWHVRYVGTGLAEQIQANRQTLEQFFNLPVFISYPANSFQLSTGN
jgi:D-alanyl-D-alanine carboxypeptidase